ncbi:hypothetical protein [Psychromonas ingrahamii]|uniref:hypothetical protein n=1 Tax=Psychromonas ingrahamii TaxID=357794 RepID=UPI000314BBB9|nr:hypothetical protein [Psychromonas ingrahamii]
MTNNETIKSLFKSLVKADLSQSEIAIINYLPAKKEKTITDSNIQMAKDLSMQHNSVGSLYTSALFTIGPSSYC